MLNVFKFVGNRSKRWRTMTPKEKWLFVYWIGTVFSESFGVTVYKTMENYWYSYAPDVASLIYTVMSLYTIWFNFKRGEYLRGLQGTTGFGVLVTCLTVQIQTLGPNRFRINGLLNFGGKYIYKDDDHLPALHVKCQRKMIHELIQHLVSVLLILFFAFLMWGTNFAYVIMVERSKISMGSSNLGFLLDLSLQMVVTFFGVLAATIVEISACLVCNIISACPYLLHIELRNLEIELKENDSSLATKVHLRNIIMTIQDHEKLVKECIDLYYTRLFIGPFLLTYSICFSMMGQFLIGYPGGYSVALFNYCLLMIACFQGQKVEDAKVAIVSELYDMQWYLLPTKSQKQVSSLMHMIQNGETLTIGPFSTLNMETASNLTKTIYSSSMLLYRNFNATAK